MRLTQLQHWLVVGLLGQSTARHLSRQNICPTDAPSVIVSIVEQVTVYPVYISTYITEKTVIVIDNGPTIHVTVVPTQIIASGLVTVTVTSTQTVHPGQ